MKNSLVVFLSFLMPIIAAAGGGEQKINQLSLAAPTDLDEFLVAVEGKFNRCAAWPLSEFDVEVGRVSSVERRGEPAAPGWGVGTRATFTPQSDGDDRYPVLAGAPYGWTLEWAWPKEGLTTWQSRFLDLALDQARLHRPTWDVDNLFIIVLECGGQVNFTITPPIGPGPYFSHDRVEVKIERGSLSILEVFAPHRKG